jgi:uncharacterized LabA/DUF88 family protein
MLCQPDTGHENKVGRETRVCVFSWYTNTRINSLRLHGNRRIITSWGLAEKPTPRFFEGNTHMDRVAVFIDGSNFYYAVKTAFSKTKLRFDQLALALTNRLPDRRLLRVYYYNAAYDQGADPTEYQKQQRFFNVLRRTPYLTLCLGRLERRAIDWSGLSVTERSELERLLKRPLPERTYVEKGVDVQLAVDMVKLAVANTYDVAVIISGDGDFAAAVEFVKQQGKHVELGRVTGAPCERLRDICDVEIPIDATMLGSCWL